MQSCYMDLSKLLHGFVKWLHGFVKVWKRVLPKNLNLTENEYHNHIIPSTWGGQSAWSREDSISAFPRIKLRDIFPKS